MTLIGEVNDYDKVASLIVVPIKSSENGRSSSSSFLAKRIKKCKLIIKTQNTNTISLTTFTSRHTPEITNMRSKLRYFFITLIKTCTTPGIQKHKVYAASQNGNNIIPTKLITVPQS
ncbi:hypothetical protein ACFX2I_013447 [Malus domestica]